MPDRVYEETEWLRSILVLLTAAGCGLAAVIGRQPPILFPAALMVAMAATLFWRVAVTFDELTVRFGIWGIRARRIARIDAQSAEVFGRRYDGVNWPIRAIRDIGRQGGGKERGVLVRTNRGDFWIQSRHPEDLAEALRTAWGLRGQVS